jgi:hypothetical protein
LDIIARSSIVTGFDLGLEVGGEVFGEGDGESVHSVLGCDSIIMVDKVAI